jgi:hypothetical protein
MAKQEQDDVDATTDPTALAALPALPHAQRGESTAAVRPSDADGSAFTVSVQNAGEASGYLCSVTAEATFPGLHPAALYAIFTHPRNDGVFSGIKRVSDRRVLEEEEEEAATAAAAAQQPPSSSTPPARIAYRKVEVEQVGELKILMIRREFLTRLIVEEDARKAPAFFQTRFHLVSSDALSRFEGSWSIDAGGGIDGGSTPIGCRVRLEQQVLPRGVPVFLQRVPVLGPLLRRVSLSAVERLLRDLQAVVRALKARDPVLASSYSADGGEFAVHAALDALKRDRRLAEQLGAAGGGGGGGASFAPDGEDADEDEDDEGEDARDKD